MQVTLNLDVERMLPDFVRRRFIVKQQTLLPNQRRGGVLGKIRMSDPTLNRITKGVRAGFSNEVKLVFFLLTRNWKCFLNFALTRMATFLPRMTLTIGFHFSRRVNRPSWGLASTMSWARWKLLRINSNKCLKSLRRPSLCSGQSQKRTASKWSKTSSRREHFRKSTTDSSHLFYMLL